MFFAAHAGMVNKRERDCAVFDVHLHQWLKHPA